MIAQVDFFRRLTNLSQELGFDGLARPDKDEERITRKRGHYNVGVGLLSVTV
jgi:hypothetical protein